MHIILAPLLLCVLTLLPATRAEQRLVAVVGWRQIRHADAIVVVEYTRSSDGKSLFARSHAADSFGSLSLYAEPMLGVTRTAALVVPSIAWRSPSFEVATEDAGSVVVHVFQSPPSPPSQQRPRRRSTAGAWVWLIAPSAVNALALWAALLLASRCSSTV